MKIIHFRIVIIFIFNLTNSWSWSQLTMTNENLLGEWAYTTSHSSKTLEIKPDGSYTYRYVYGRDMDFGKLEAGGNWIIKNDVLILRQTRKKVGWGRPEKKTNMIFQKLILINCDQREGPCLVKKISGQEEVIYWRS